MTYAESVTYLAELGHELSRVKFDLEAIRRVLAGLGDPQRAYPTAIVAGTNGKGSTCAMLSEILHCAGFRTGLYTSPHLVRVNERIRVADAEIEGSDFAAAATAVRDGTERLLESGLSVHLSFFEFLTAMAFVHFAREAVDFAVLEVGMGGRLDATNVTEHRVAVITNVDLDHEQFLGHTRAAIAAEKAGVIRAGCPVVSGCEDEETGGVVRRRSEELGAEWIDLPRRSRVGSICDRAGFFSFDLELDGERFADLAPSLAGEVQIRNATAAVAAAAVLRRGGMRISVDAIREGLRAARWPGRLETLHDGPRLLLDGAHNPAAARELAGFVAEDLAGRRIRLVYASMRDKNIGEIARALFPLAIEVYITRTATGRAASPEEILERAGWAAAKVLIQEDPVRAVQEACRVSAKDDVVLVAGSLFLVGAVEEAWRAGILDFGSGQESGDASLTAALAHVHSPRRAL
ncbi:MAG: bifunctional folylpolyglutamate synthase/dihydrofolate synthase [Terriglobia bacterium]